MSAPFLSQASGEPVASGQMELSVIFVNWNSVAYLRQCLASIYKNTGGIRFELIVVDNASPDRDIDDLTGEFPGVVFIQAERNLGFAAANNLGFSRSTGEYLLFLNPDTQVIGAALITMLERCKALPDAGVMGARLLNTDLSIQLTAVQKLPTLLNQLLDIEYLQVRWPGCPLWDISPLFAKPAGPVRVEAISGACMLLRRSVFEAAGLFTEDYFMYAEDIDLNYKVSRLGYCNYYLDDAVIVHHGGKSASQNVSHWATVMKYRAMLRFFQRTKGSLYGSLYPVMVGGVAILRLSLLGLAYPLGGLIFKRNSIQRALKKWRIALKWALRPSSQV
jgi:GT2 family glycosyltransferase